MLLGELQDPAHIQTPWQSCTRRRQVARRGQHYKEASACAFRRLLLARPATDLVDALFSIAGKYFGSIYPDNRPLVRHPRNTSLDGQPHGRCGATRPSMLPHSASKQVRACVPPMAMPHVNRAPWHRSAASAFFLVACKPFCTVALRLVVGGDVTWPPKSSVHVATPAGTPEYYLQPQQPATVTR